MKQLLILSGKGGTGKTTVAAAFIKLSGCRAYADCDVDAPNLHLLLHPSAFPHSRPFYGMGKYEIDSTKCLHCGLCQQVCRFEAVHENNFVFFIDHLECEGCATCAYVCPAQCIKETPHHAGYLLLDKPEPVFSTAKLFPGSGNSGLLVTEVKKQLRQESIADFEIIDGSPGIGCPVIASMNNASLILLVTEPTLSGLSDFQRIVTTAEKMHVPTAVCINKVMELSAIVEKTIDYCQKKQIPMVGLIPYDKTVSRNINQGLSVIDTDCPAKTAIMEVYQKVIQILFEKQEKSNDYRKNLD
jgi:MinD superfamily P-loop ATPase